MYFFILTLKYNQTTEYYFKSRPEKQISGWTGSSQGLQDIEISVNQALFLLEIVIIFIIHMLDNRYDVP